MVWTVSDSTTTRSVNSNRFENLKMKVTTAIGYLIPFMASLPPLGAWSGLMTVPFIIYLMMMFGNTASAPLPFPDLTRPGPLLVVTCSGLGLLLLLYSVVHLWRAKTEGLVTSGPYRMCRHPQYFSLIIFTLIMTYQSIWILQNTFGMGWLTVDQTRMLWILTLVAYVILAWAEEMHLEKQFGEEWTQYRMKVGFLFPFIPLKSRFVEGLIAIIIPYVLLEGLLLLPIIL